LKSLRRGEKTPRARPRLVGPQQPWARGKEGILLRFRGPSFGPRGPEGGTMPGVVGACSGGGDRATPRRGFPGQKGRRVEVTSFQARLRLAGGGGTQVCFRGKKRPTAFWQGINPPTPGKGWGLGPLGTWKPGGSRGKIGSEACCPEFFFVLHGKHHSGEWVPDLGERGPKRVGLYGRGGKNPGASF